MGIGHTRITVVSPDRRLDLSLPGSVPLGDLMPQLVDMCTDHHDRSTALAWTLHPVGGPALGWASSLESARVRDGAVLELSPRSAGVAQPTIEDVRDAIEDAVDQAAGTWTRRATATMAALVLAGVAVLVLAVPNLWTASWANGLAVAGTCASLLLCGAMWVADRELPVGAHALLVAGLAWTGAVVIAATEPPASAATAFLAPAPRAALCAVAVLCSATMMSRSAPRLSAWSAVAAAAGVAGCAAITWTATDLAGRSADDAVAVGIVLGVLSLGVLPRMSLAAGGLAGLDYLARTRGSVEPAVVAERFARSRAMLTGALLGTAGLVAVGAAGLGLAGSSMQVAQSTAVACCLLLRARAFSQLPDVLTLGLAGAMSLLVPLAFDLAAGHPRPPSIVILALVIFGSAWLIVGGSSQPSDVAAARGRRLLDIAESLAVATLIPLLAANLGALEWVTEWVN